MKRIVTIAVCVLMAAAGWCQAVVEGVVTDSASGERLGYVSVGLMGRQYGGTANERGYYRLELPADDTLHLRFSHTGYRPHDERLVLRDGERLTLNVRLRAEARQLGEVTVSGDKNRSTTFTQIGVDKLDEAVGPAGGVESVIKTLPDVNSNNELSSQYSVRGGSFDENLVYINGVEVFRPMLIRSGQQEGMSIINPDLVDYILFSPGGFDASYGDKMSSVLDITYRRPVEFDGRISASLLGAAASVEGKAGERWSYAAALRQHSNRYILGSLDTKGSYSTSYTDMQTLLGYKVNDRLDLGAMAIVTRNVYGLVPESQTTTFGGFMMPMELRIYFDGQEQDRYMTALGALTADYRPDDDWHLRANLAVQHINERENYDVQDQYWLYELGLGETEGEVNRLDRGVGTFLEHARNRLVTDIYSLDAKAIRQARLGQWEFGLKVQLENISDHLREWKWVDSAGYAVPMEPITFGDSSAMPASPILQYYTNADNTLRTLRGSLYAQRELNFETRRRADVRVVAGLRGQVYGNSLDDKLHTLLSPRLSASYKPDWKQDILFRLAAGLYQQAPFYREYRRDDGTLCAGLEPQKSYQVTATADWRLRLWDKPFTITVDLYYKYITNLVPYTVDNLRLRYMPDTEAVGYATGLSLRINGELIEGLESWASLSIMQTQEDIAGDGLSWLARPTDQRFSFKMFLQDNIPDIPWWKMSLSFMYGSRLPVTIPMTGRTEETFRMPAYFRIDWGNTVSLAKFDKLCNTRLFRHLEDIQVGVEVFNLFNYRNVVSYLWVSDYNNIYYPVPNYLTARQLNVKVTVLF